VVNEGTQAATNVRVMLTALTPGVTVTDGFATFPDVPAGGSVVSGGTDFAFTVGTAVACGSSLLFDVTILADQGAWSEALAAPTGFGNDPGSTTVYPSADVPKSIPDPGSTSSAITLPFTNIVGDVNVTVTLTHTRDSDLTLTLIAPNLSTVTL